MERGGRSNFGIRGLAWGALSLSVPAAAWLWLHHFSWEGQQAALAPLQYFFFPALFLFLAPLFWGSRNPGAPRGRFGGALPGHLAGGALAATLTLLLLGTIRPGMWIQWDETLLQATARGMHFFRFNAYVKESPVGAALPVLLIQDQRPPLFPFLLSVLHDLLGARSSNAYLLNGLLLFTGLWLLFLALFRRFGVPAAAALLFILSDPIVSWCATSAGYDLLALLLLGLTVHAAAAFARDPGPRTLLRFLLVGVLFSYGRYESILLFGLLGLISAAWAGRAGWAATRGYAWLALLPPLFTPLLLSVTGGGGGSYAGFYQGLDKFYDVAPFRLSYIPGNLAEFARAFFSWGARAPYTGLLHGVGALALGIALWKLGRRAPGLWLALGAVLASLLLICGFRFGGALRSESMRLFLPVIALFAISPVLLLAVFPGRFLRWGLLAVGLILFAWRLPEAREGRGEFTAYESRAAGALGDLLEKFPAAPNDLFVFEVPQFVVATGHEAIGPARLRDHWREIREAQRLGQVGKLFLVDFFPANVKSPVKMLARNFAVREVASGGGPDATVRILEIPAP